MKVSHNLEKYTGRSIKKIVDDVNTLLTLTSRHCVIYHNTTKMLYWIMNKLRFDMMLGSVLIEQFSIFLQPSICKKGPTISGAGCRYVKNHVLRRLQKIRNRRYSTRTRLSYRIFTTQSSSSTTTIHIA